MHLNFSHDNSTDILEYVETLRHTVDLKLADQRRVQMGQFMTPAPVARFMASLFQNVGREVRLLDPGAGVGSLSVAFVDHVLRLSVLPSSILVHSYELENSMLTSLTASLKWAEQACAQRNVSFRSVVRSEDFILASTDLLAYQHSFFEDQAVRFTHCIMNPPYRKIKVNSVWRAQLQRIGIQTSNLYTGFLATAVKLLEPGGELVAIVPRSFCNGVYFRQFREFFLAEMSLKHLHVFDSRESVFKDNKVLQENIILYAVKGAPDDSVTITASLDPSLKDLTLRVATCEQVVNPKDPEQFINIATDEVGQMVVDRLRTFDSSLDDLGLSVKTGPVVDFRVKSDLRKEQAPDTVPLIYPNHFKNHRVVWPKSQGRKSNAIAVTTQSKPWLMPNDWYVLTKRFTSKEEKRRVVAAIYDPSLTPTSRVGFENHLNVFHNGGSGLKPALARGLAVFLNSTLIDLYFRQFSGHTQVNAADLRMLRYPDRCALVRLGQGIGQDVPLSKKSMHESTWRFFRCRLNIVHPIQSRCSKEFKKRLQS
ncbi:MAG: N-6 DNA methylase [Caldilineaceae bacterium]|nr:N-6 DNA methylase [Caldilineaceae bacterium]